MKTLRALTRKPIIGPVFKFVEQIVINYGARKIARHFSEYLKPVVAENEFLRSKSFNIRHDVYCEELKFEPPKPDKLEKDKFDAHSFHCLIQHKESAAFAGTVRVVYSTSADQQLPIEKYCLDTIDDDELTPTNFPRDKICEISRLAVPAEFRRRKADKFKGAATGNINDTVYSERELRCFPFIAVGLYLSAASLVINKGIEHVFVMMEPRLARSLKLVGIQFKQIGPVVEYHGKRAPFYITPEMLFENLSPGFRTLFDGLHEEIDEQLNQQPELLDRASLVQSNLKDANVNENKKCIERALHFYKSYYSEYKTYWVFN